MPISLELGGKSPSIVLPDANEDWVLDGMVAAMRFSRQSQSCTAGSRLFLHRDIFDDFLEGLGRKVKALKIGDPLDEASDIGTIINEKQFKKVCGYVEEGLKQRDARVVIGGLPPTDGPLERRLLSPSPPLRRRRQRLAVGARGDLWTGAGGYPLVRRGRRHPHGERQPLRACRLCLVTRYRQSACAPRMRSKSGWVQVNQGLGQQPGHSYGGYKESGIGREFSLEGMLDSYTQGKNVTVNLTH